MTAVAALLGLGTATGLLLLVSGWRGTTSAQASQRGSLLVMDRVVARRFAVAIVIGGLAGVVTGWWAGALLAAAGAWALPGMLGPDRAHTARVARFEAIATWAEMLRDTLAAAAGLEQAITVTAPRAPAAISSELTVVARRLDAGDRLPAVLRGLAEDLADPTADLVLTALIHAVEQRARHLGELLGGLAQVAREHAALRMRVEAGRAQARTAARITVLTTVVFAAGLVMLDRAYLAAFDSGEGQLVLLTVGGLFAAGFGWLHRLARVPEPARILTTTHAQITPRPHTAVVFQGIDTKGARA